MIVFDETLRGANEGLTPDELASKITLPDRLASSPYLQEYYGVISWSVRSIYTGYLGWFDGNPTQLFPLAPKEEAAHLIDLIGSKEAVFDSARQALEEGQAQWACQLVDHLLALEPTSREFRSLKAAALRRLADQQMSSNARNYYLSSAKELEDSSTAR